MPADNTFSTIEIARDGHVLTATLNRPERLNAVDGTMHAELEHFFADLAEDDDVDAVVLTGSGRAFCAGGDVKAMAEGTMMQTGRQAPLTWFTGGPHRLIRNLLSVPQPIVAAVNGDAVGVGATMLLHCDLVYASTTARFLFPFINLALVPEFGSSLLLPAVVGRHRAAELLMLGEPFGAERAREMGLVNAVTDGDALDLAREAATKLAAKPPTAIRLTKRLLSSRAPLEERMQRELEYFGSQLASDEARAAMTALVERWKAQGAASAR